MSLCTNYPQGGYYLFILLDWYSGSWSLMLLAILEVNPAFLSYGLGIRFIFPRIAIQSQLMKTSDLDQVFTRLKNIF